MYKNRVNSMRLLTLAFLALCCAIPVAWAQDEFKKHVVMVPMRDGVVLATNLYLPEGDGPWPAVLTRTPYNKNGADRSATIFTSRGYALVSQDVRGRNASGGENRPFETDIDDGYDTVEWIAAQEFSNGKIGIFGTSAPGITSNLAAAAAPPHLTAAYVTVAPDSLFYRSRFVGGVFKESHSGGWLRGQGVSDDAIAAYKARAGWIRISYSTDTMSRFRSITSVVGTTSTLRDHCITTSTCRTRATSGHAASRNCSWAPLDTVLYREILSIRAVV
jgi:predicted acyl esterase